MVTTALGYTPYNSTNPNGYISGITSGNVTTALGYTPENAANKGNANGYASLDGSGLIPASQLPSYVDDVLEYTNLASFPGAGTTGKIYVALDTNKTYRWSGSAYIYITSGAVDSVAGKTGVVTLNNSDVGLGNVENKSSATIRSEITSSNVTTALGFTPYNATNPSGYISGITSSNVTTALGYTPYNATNPSGYITSSALSSYLPLSGGTLTGQLIIGATGTANSPTLRLNTSSSGAFVHSQENLAANLTTGQHVISVIGRTGNTKNSGYIGYTWAGDASNSNYVTIGHWGADDLLRVYGDGNVTVGANSVLHAGNYNSYAPTLTGANASGTWGINITGNATTATSATDSTKLPLTGGTLSGNLMFSDSGTTKRGIQGTVGGNDFWFIGGGATGSNAGFMEIATGDDGQGGAGAAEPIYVSQYGPGDPLTGTLFRRASLLDTSGNTSFPGTISASSFAGSLATGFGASGTWGISISGNAATATDSNQLGGISSNRAMLKRRGRIHTDDGTSLNTSISTPEMGFTYGGSGEPVGPYIAFGGLGGNIDYSMQLVGQYNAGGNYFVIRTRNDDLAIWNPWRTILTDSNYNSYALPLSGGTVTGQIISSANGNQLRFVRADGTTPNWTFHGWGGGLNIYSSAVSTVYIGRDGPGTNLDVFNGSLTQGGNQVLHAGNYSSYAIQHINGDSGAFNLNVSGQQSFVRFSTGVWVNPPIAGNYSHVLSVNAATDNRTFQIYMGDVPGTVYYRPNQEGTWHPWERILSSNNYNSYSPTLTGGGASGTWGINITGNAGSATTEAKSSTTTVPASTAFTRWLFATNSTSGTQDWNHISNIRPGVGEVLLLGNHANGPGGGNYYHPLNFEYSSIGGTGNITQLAIAYGSPGNELYMRGSYSGSWNGWNRFLNSSNYNSYALPLSGGTLTGNLTMNGPGASTAIIFGDVTKLINVEGYWMMFKGHQNEGFRWQTSDGSSFTTRMQLTSSALTLNGNTVLHAGNYSSYALPLSGGTISGNQTITGNLTVSSGNTTGNGIILADDGDIVDLNDGYCAMRFSYGVRIHAGNRTGGAVHTLHSNGTFTASNNITAYSDERLKTNWLTIEPNFIEKLAKVKSGTYTRLDLEGKQRQAGSSAQDWQKLLPEVVTEADDEAKTLTLAYGNAALVSAIELAKEVVDLKSKLNQQQSELDELKSLVQSLLANR
jgi:hypothetical protein